MRRSTALSLSLQLVFPGLAYNKRQKLALAVVYHKVTTLLSKIRLGWKCFAAAYWTEGGNYGVVSFIE
jgi:hypothetical protein